MTAFHPCENTDLSCLLTLHFLLKDQNRKYDTVEREEKKHTFYMFMKLDSVTNYKQGRKYDLIRNTQGGK